MLRKIHGVFYLSYYRLGVYLIISSFVWGLYLMRLNLENSRPESEYLKEKIVALSKQYIQTLAKEKRGELTIDGQDSVEMQDLKRATAVLLQNMLDRIHQLEEQVEHVIVNNTSEFAQLSKRLKYLNSTVYNLTRNAPLRKECVIPDDPGFPECQAKVKWVQGHWKSDPKFSQHGVNGSLCSILRYLSTVEGVCPKTFTKTVLSQPHFCEIPQNPAYPSCASKVLWMRASWKSDPKFQKHGVDGSDCSFLIYLSEVEHWCPPIQDRYIPLEDDCVVPTESAYPECAGKVAWMKNFWRSDICYSRDYGVNGSVCSFLVYLSEVEQWCPRLRSRPPPTNASTKQFKYPDDSRTDVEGLISLLKDNDEIKFRWIKSRIRRMWPDWIRAYQMLKKKRKNLSDYPHKKILVHMGLLANEKMLHFGAEAFKGGPLGELVQWSDLLASLYILGHTIEVSANAETLKGKVAGRIVKSNCPMILKETFDLIFLDYYGIKQLMSKVGSVLPHYKCRFRVLDSFGTEAQFNYDGYKQKMEGGFFGTWGRHNLNLKQFMTMFPHSPDNSFLGFVVDGVNMTAGKPVKKNQALVYGKHYYMWQGLQGNSYLDVIEKSLEIHATVGAGKDGNDDNLVKYVPKFVKNHGILSSREFYSLLRESKVFVGLGTPYEGPAALEAIASGCVFLNPKNIPPKDRSNTKFFKDKPTLRALTSQHPYAEEFIGKPHVYTLDINNPKEVQDAISEIMNTEVDPYLPYEFTHEGMLERLYSFMKHQDFCKREREVWPPPNSSHVYKGSSGQSCKDVCHQNGYVCEPAFFPLINKVELLEKASVPCKTTKVESFQSLVAPAFRTEHPSCLLQTQPLLFSCTAKSPLVQRLCPCRDYRKGQVALCKDC